MAVTLEQINITVPAQLARFVRRRVSSGKFDSPSAVVRDALQRAMEAEAQIQTGRTENWRRLNLPKRSEEYSAASRIWTRDGTPSLVKAASGLSSPIPRSGTRSA